MRKKGRINKILLALVIILAGAVAYLTLFNKQTTQPSIENNSTTSQKVIPKSINWESFIPAIKTTLGPTFLGEQVEEFYPLSIFQKNDITGDGAEEALVDLGNGGAHTSFLTLMRIEKNKPTVAQFKQKDGKTSPLIFLTGASAMNGENVVMLPEKNAIYAGHWEREVNNSSNSLANCNVEVYKWNLQTKIFDFSLSLSSEIKPIFCQKVEQTQQ